MKNLRMRGGVAAAIVAAAAMVLSTIAIAPANAADGDAGVCNVTDANSFQTELKDSSCTTLNLVASEKLNDTTGIIRFNYQEDLVKLGGADAYGVPVSITMPTDRPIVIISDSQTILRNVQFTVPQGANLTFAKNVVLDDVNLSGYDLLGLNLIGLGVSGLSNLIKTLLGQVVGVEYGVNVDGGTFSTTDNAIVAVGANAVTKPNRGIVISANGSTVNLGSTGTYDRESVHALLDSSIPLLGDLLKALTFTTKAAYPTVWGRDAAVYSNTGVSNSTINITNGTYSNQKDSSTDSGVINGAISTSGTVNITGTNNVRISSTKIGNYVDSNHNGHGTSTIGTLNLDNPNAVLDPKVEGDTDVERAKTDSWALELRGAATANIVAGHVQDTLHTDAPKVIESEQNSKVNILASKQGDANITANGNYWIGQVQKQADNTFAAQVNSTASTTLNDPAGTNNYELWTSGAQSSDNALTQLGNLLAAETAGSTPAAAKLNDSTYKDGKLTADYADATNQAIYGRKVISDGSTSVSPFQTVNISKDKTKVGGTVTLYGAPWTGTYKPGDTAPQQTGKLFAGWYTSQSQWKDEDDIQGSSLNRGSTGDKPKHHVWASGSKDWNNTIVLNKSSYSGSLYPHFVGSNTITVTGQTADATNQKENARNIRLLAGLDSYNFKGVTFTVTLGKATKSMFTGTAYDYVTEGTVKKAFAENPAYKDNPSAYTEKTAQGQARYLATGVISNVPFGKSFTVVPKWTTLDGTVVTGAAQTVTLDADGNLTIK